MGAEAPSLPPYEYQVCREKISEFLEAVGERRAIYRDRETAQQAGFRDVVAPPMFAVVYCTRPLLGAVRHPEVGIDMRRMVHSAQSFQWREPVCAGDVITTEVQLADVSERGPNKAFTFGSRSQNQDGQQTALGSWTMLVKGG